MTPTTHPTKERGIHIGVILGAACGLAIDTSWIIGSGGWILLAFYLLLIPPLAGGLIGAGIGYVIRVPRFNRPLLLAFGVAICAFALFAQPLIMKARFTRALDSMPVMPNATGPERHIQLLAGDSEVHASLTYHVTASWRDVASFYEKELLSRGWHELVWYKQKDGPPLGRFRTYGKGSSEVVSVYSYPGNQDDPDHREDQEVNLIIELVDLPPGYSYMGYVPYVPSSSGSTTEDVPPVDKNAWKPWALRQYDVVIPLPPGWTYSAGYQPDGSLNFLDRTTTAVVANLKCPIPETGFEAWTFETATETYEKNGELHGKTLWIGTERPGTDVGDLNILFIHRNDFDHWLDDAGHSCMITSSGDKDLLEEMYRRIQ